MPPRLQHSVIWDDQDRLDQQLDPREMMQRLARVLGADLTEKLVRDEPRYELRRRYPDGFELLILAGHIYDDRERLSMAFELWGAMRERPVASYHLSGGLDRIKASTTTAWIRAANGTVVILGEGLGGILEVQN